MFPHGVCPGGCIIAYFAYFSTVNIHMSSQMTCLSGYIVTIFAFLSPCVLSCVPECDVPVPGIFHFFGGIGTGIGTNWYRKKVSEPVSKKFGTGKKSRNRYRQNLVPEKSGTGKSLGNGIGKI